MDSNKKSRSELKREAIINAALQAFKQDGVANTSMDRLAQLAQVSKRTVYNHFKTKEALVMHLLSDLWEQAMVNAQYPYQPDLPIREQVVALAKIEAEFVGGSHYIDLARVAFGHLLFHPEALKQEMEKVGSQETAIVRWLKEAQASNRLKPLDVETVNIQLHSLLKGSCFYPQLLGFKAPLNEQEMDQLIEESVDMFMARYGKED
ncbi:TetR/AcrR family transcriptional regulator [Vibrio sp. SCSIO 43136]|uniref:TetR/AcrR family transcriptional regulator n=1 Tax=Vibrio sp. SCSIO 43136 TaxID=2819101 RepID=UPI0020753B64|nr:TetR/AcrR family transcriptional regulator [Vibrio sp. SCSIO 43136]USD67051.1 TetR/AcrR family transcriptional regulator [Vibrio sp. SCSIO 43136]